MKIKKSMMIASTCVGVALALVGIFEGCNKGLKSTSVSQTSDQTVKPPPPPPPPENYGDILARKYSLFDGERLFISPTARKSSGVIGTADFSRVSESFEKIYPVITSGIKSVNSGQFLCVIDGSSGPTQFVAVAYLFLSKNTNQCQTKARAFNSANSLSSSKMYLLGMDKASLSAEKVYSLYDASWRTLGQFVVAGLDIHFVDRSIDILIMKKLIADASTGSAATVVN